MADLAACERDSGSANRIDLEELSPKDGAKLLEELNVKGEAAELEEASREMKGHALALTLVGSFLADACHGDIRRRKEIGPLEDDITGGEHAKRVMAAYARWLGDGPEVAVLRLLGLFDRPAEEGCLRALRAEPAIPKLTEKLVTLSDVQWNQTVSKLRRRGKEKPANQVGEHARRFDALRPELDIVAGDVPGLRHARTLLQTPAHDHQEKRLRPPHYPSMRPVKA